jgi:ketosteroid isomerase-like protein
MSKFLMRVLLGLALPVILPTLARAQGSGAANSATVEEVRAAIRQYDEALRRGDAEAAQRFWATEFTFVNPNGERLTRADRIANLRSGRTTFDSLSHTKREEEIRTYGDKDIVAVYTTHLTIGGRYSGHAEQGQFRAIVVWVKRDGRWQQVANQLTRVLNE